MKHCEVMVQVTATSSNEADLPADTTATTAPAISMAEPFSRYRHIKSPGNSTVPFNRVAVTDLANKASIIGEPSRSNCIRLAFEKLETS